MALISSEHSFLAPLITCFCIVVHTSIDLVQRFIGFSECLPADLTGAGRPSGLVVTRYRLLILVNKKKRMCWLLVMEPPALTVNPHDYMVHS